MNSYDYLRFGAALIFVLSLMGGLSYAVKRFNLGQGAILSPTKKRLRIVEILPLDGRRKAILIKRDETEHLVIFSASGETVIETNITAPIAAKAASKTVKKKEKKTDDKASS
jgi:flagellar protein FliO/FliZ